MSEWKKCKLGDFYIGGGFKSDKFKYFNEDIFEEIEKDTQESGQAFQDIQEQYPQAFPVSKLH